MYVISVSTGVEHFGSATVVLKGAVQIRLDYCEISVLTSCVQPLTLCQHGSRCAQRFSPSPAQHIHHSAKTRAKTTSRAGEDQREQLQRSTVS